MENEPRIMIVEAEVLVRHPLAEYLRECGYKVCEAVDAQEAARLMAQDDLPIDIVLIEGEAGIKFAHWLRERYPQVQVMQAGTVARATEKAGELCADGPAERVPYDHQFVLEHIRRLTAARARGGG